MKMKNLKIVLGVSILSVFALISCQNKTEEPTVTVHEEQMSDMMQPSQTTAYNVGDKVPNKQVCMVNNAYMGKDQFEVPYDGKTYYGCCKMCVERIPNDETARKAKDPFTGKEIDKANAYIVLKDQQGNVDYFENEENYKKFSQL
ncbi:hypothetical protein OBK29_10420 [Empedobacter falsenii]|uniref:hypothetical protein n=2 Tax=Weeksellaceae TaxID=2762318 RepID=UPI001C59547E|nr:MULTISPECIES: hypothetical protein [Empedobacter]MBW1618492.1 hypothetical protein [Empedobacter falsenii]MDM1139390.1 hypothetical protein [Empedobacter sp. R132-2]